MIVLNSTDVRKEWSTIIDSVIREKPKFIKRTRDYMFLSNIDILTSLLSAYSFTAEKYIEKDGSVTVVLNEIDLAENGKDEEEAKLKLAKSIIDYSENFYTDFDTWLSAPNRKCHIPYVLKALITDDEKKLGDLIKCHAGRI